MKYLIAVTLLAQVIASSAQKSNLPGGYDVFVENGKTGVKDYDENILVPAEFDRVSYNKELDAIECYNGKEFKLLSFYNNSFIEGLSCTSVTKDNSDGWLVKSSSGTGYLDQNYRMVVPALYDKITRKVEIFPHMCAEYFFVEKGGKKGLYLGDSLILKPEYDEIRNFRQTRLVELVKDKKSGVAISNSDGYTFSTLLDYKYDNIRLIENVMEGGTFFTYQENGRYGLIYYYDSDNLLRIVPALYSKIDTKKAVEEEPWGMLKAEKDGKKGHLIVRIYYDENSPSPFFATQFRDFGYSSNLRVADENGKWGVISHDSPDPKIPFLYDEMLNAEEFYTMFEGEIFSDDLLVKKDGKWGTINEYTGEITLEIIYATPKEIPSKYLTD